MAFKTLNELLVLELRDLYSAEQMVNKELPKYIKAVTEPELRTVFEKHLQESHDQIRVLEQVFDIIGEDATPKTCKAMEGLVREGEELLDARGKAEPAALDAAIIAAAQKIEHYEIATYGTVREWAQQCGFPEAAELLQKTLDQEKAANEKLTKVAKNINPKAQYGTGSMGR